MVTSGSGGEWCLYSTPCCTVLYCTVCTVLYSTELRAVLGAGDTLSRGANVAPLYTLIMRLFEDVSLDQIL